MKDNEQALDFSFVLASSVHDMKNSLGMLLSTIAQLSEQSPAKTEQEKNIYATLEYEAARINNELIHLLSLYRMQEQRMLVQIDHHYLAEIIDEQLARNSVLFKTRGITVNVNCPEDLHWYCDAELIGGVINATLVNAARYSREIVELSVTYDGEYLHLSVKDDGKGYTEKMLTAPLNEQAGVSFSTGSTNLGLVFASKVAALHRSGSKEGRIQLSNAEEGGGIFSLYLP